VNATIEATRPVTINFLTETWSDGFTVSGSSGNYNDADLEIAVSGTSFWMADWWGELIYVEACYGGGVGTPDPLTVPTTSATGSYSVSWGASATSGVTYRLEEATNAAFTSDLRTVVSGTASLSATINGRTSGITYYYRVRAEKDGIFSEWRTGGNGCFVGTPGTPSTISVPTTNNTGSYTVSWSASATPGVTYRLEEAINSGFSYGLRTVASGTTSLSAAISGRTSGVTYYYRVRAEKNGAVSTWRTGGNGCVVTVVAPAAPGSITVPSTNSTGSYTVTWGASATSEVTYRLEEATNSGFTTGLRTVVSGTTALSAAISGRSSGVTYFYRVRAENAAGSSAWRTGGNGCVVTIEGGGTWTTWWSGANTYDLYRSDFPTQRPITIRVYYPYFGTTWEAYIPSAAYYEGDEDYWELNVSGNIFDFWESGMSYFNRIDVLY
jgi:hypothetical protein